MKRNKLEICKQTRKVASDSLYKVLARLLKSKEPISEIMLRDAWLLEMRKNKSIFPDGWYIPPPHGIIVLFATDENVGRLSFKSIRPKEFWPREDVFLDPKKGIVYLYASPVDKKTGIIGDFAITLYFGKNSEIKNLLKTCLKLDKQIFDYVKLGLKFSDISLKAEKLMKKYDMENEAVAFTDKGEMVIGHTIPDGFDKWEGKEKKLVTRRENWDAIKDVVSKKRVNVKKNEPFVVERGSAFTIEPRPTIVSKPYLPKSLSYHMIALVDEEGEKELLTGLDDFFTLAGMEYMLEPMKKQKINYVQSGVNYGSLDPAKKLSLKAAKETAINLRKFGFKELSDTRGEAAYVWDQGNVLMATVAESLGTKNIVADEARKVTGKTYYDVIGNDTVAAIINDLVSVGAKPLTVNAFWAVGQGEWLDDQKRIKDLVFGWKRACDLAGASWGGGETPSYYNIVERERVALGGSAVGIIRNKKNLVTDKKLKVGDRIILIKSSGVNANGISLARAVAKRLPKGYGTKLPNGKSYGESLLTKSNIYAKVVQDLQKANVDIHYISNITGHGIRKVMRARPNFTYVLEKIFKPQPVFDFIKKHANLDDYEMYQTYNMGQDYALFIPQKDVDRCLKIIAKNKFVAIDAGYIEKGEKQVIIKPKNLTFRGETLDLR